MKQTGKKIVPWQGRTYVMFGILVLAVILNLVGLQYVVQSASEHDLEFDYTYTWHVQGNRGDYYGYTEDFSATGHYVVDFSGATASVVASVSWQLKGMFWGSVILSNSSTSTHAFTYGSTYGEYISGTDQDRTTTGEHVWFHVPGGFSRVPWGGGVSWVVAATGSQHHAILDTADYIVTGESTAWAGHLMPVRGIGLHSAGSYLRDDEYGQFDATYDDTYVFTQDGFLVSEVYHETDAMSSSGPTYFTLDSYLYVTRASYARSVDVVTLLLAYWLPFALLLLIVYPLYDKARWGARTINVGGQLFKLHYSVPPELVFKVDSPYEPLMQSYLLRSRASGGFTVTVCDNAGVIHGIGIVDSSEDFGTFFGTKEMLGPMMKYAGVSQAFCDAYPTTLKKIEEYDVLRVNNIQGMDISYDAGLIKPLDGKYLDPVMKMVAYEDHGKPDPKLAQWVKAAVKTDIAFVAVAPAGSEWVVNCAAGIREPKLLPQSVEGEVIIGVGFATPSGNSAWLYGLYVHPAFRNTGMGKTLVMARLAALKEMGVEHAITEIAEWNGPAKRIYKRFETESMGKIYFVGKKMPKVKVRRH